MWEGFIRLYVQYNSHYRLRMSVSKSGLNQVGLATVGGEKLHVDEWQVVALGSGWNRCVTYENTCWCSLAQRRHGTQVIRDKDHSAEPPGALMLLSLYWFRRKWTTRAVDTGRTQCSGGGQWWTEVKLWSKWTVNSSVDESASRIWMVRSSLAVIKREE